MGFWMGLYQSPVFLRKMYGAPPLMVEFWANHVVMADIGLTPGIFAIASAGILLSHICHLLSVLVLYNLSVLVFKEKSNISSRRLAYVSALLHILSPAGSFLSAPYTESLFSFLHFSALYVYTLSLKIHAHDPPNHGVIFSTFPVAAYRDMLLLLAGALMGAATTIRSNGVLSGTIFLFDALLELKALLYKGGRLELIRRLIFLVLGGTCIAIGFAVPQYLAYMDFCVQSNPENELRPWCTLTIPSVYSWVQSYYW